MRPRAQRGGGEHAEERILAEVRALAQVIGEDDLSAVDKLYMQFGRDMEDRFLNQSFDTNRDINETLDIMWDLLRILPREELGRIKPELIEKYLGAQK